tara:strand:+ start:596 stop:1366 length:771 start_codon:yes stop_codon:yes gene_type:complete
MVMIKQAKKYFGQHFLINKLISQKIVDSITFIPEQYIIEIGPGRGALTEFLISKSNQIKLIEIDSDCIDILENKFPNTEIICDDFLKIDLKKLGLEKYSVIGNFPYNISSQILFKVLENRNNITQVVGMFQKEVADRICSEPKSKKYGILSVLIQAYFHCEQLFDVSPNNFNPKPKVYSSVIKLSRNNITQLNCDHNKFKEIVKLGFSQRRKKLKNALKKIITLDYQNTNIMMTKRAEELSVSDFIELTNLIFPKS